MIQFGSLDGVITPFYVCNAIINSGVTMELIETNKRPHGIGGKESSSGVSQTLKDFWLQHTAMSSIP